MRKRELRNFFIKIQLKRRLYFETAPGKVLPRYTQRPMILVALCLQIICISRILRDHLAIKTTLKSGLFREGPLYIKTALQLGESCIMVVIKKTILNATWSFERYDNVNRVSKTVTL